VRKQNASVAKHVDNPSGSEDSALSASDDNDETEILAKEQKCMRRLSSDQQKAEPRKRYVWKNDTLVSDDVFSEFSGNVNLPQNVLDLQTPLQFFFLYFLSDEIVSLIAEQTTLYSFRQCPENPFKVTRERTIIGSVSYRNRYWAYRIESYRLLLYRPIHRCRFSRC